MFDKSLKLQKILHCAGVWRARLLERVWGWACARASTRVKCNKLLDGSAKFSLDLTQIIVKGEVIAADQHNHKYHDLLGQLRTFFSSKVSHGFLYFHFCLL